MEAELLEPETQHDASAFPAVASSVVVGVHDEADLALAVLVAGIEQAEVADQPARRPEVGGQVQAVALLVDRDLGLPAPEHLARLVA